MRRVFFCETTRTPNDKSVERAEHQPLQALGWTLLAQMLAWPAVWQGLSVCGRQRETAVDVALSETFR
jgi:hypothetical protein